MAYSYITSAKGNALADAVTNAVDTTGADFFVLVIACPDTYTDTPTDSYGNTWTEITSYSNAEPKVRTFYSTANGGAGAGHTFTAPNDVVGTIFAAAFSGGDQSAPLDVQNGANAYASSLATGQITPTENDCLIIAGYSVNGSGASPMSIDSGMTEVQEENFVSGTSYGGSISYKIQTTATAINPTLTRSDTNGQAATVISFKPQGGSASSSPSPSPSPVSAIKVMGYYPVYRVGNPSIANLPYDKLTHIHFFNLAPTAIGGITYPEGSLLPHLPTLVSTAHANDTKVVLTIGGAGAATDATWRAAITTYKTTFINNLSSLMSTYGFDGFDLDWEPFSSESDSSDFVSFVSDLRTELGAGATLTAFLGNQSWKQTMANTMQADIDFYNISSYDMSYGISQVVHDAPLYSLGGQPAGASADDLVQAYTTAGVAASKINIGVPWYAQSWPGETTLYDAATANNFNYVNYDDLAGVSGTTPPTGELYDSTAKAAYISGDPWTSYNNAQAVTDKLTYIEDNGLAGIAIWDIGSGYFPGDTPAYPLLEPVADKGPITSASSSPSTSPSSSPSLSPSTSPSSSVSSSASSSPSPSVSSSPSPSPSPSISSSPSPSESSSPSPSESSSPSSSPSTGTSESSSPSPSESSSPSSSASSSPSPSESASVSSSPSTSPSTSPSPSVSSSVSSSPSPSVSSSPSPSASSSPSSSPSESVSPSASPSPQIWGDLGINLKTWTPASYK